MLRRTGVLVAALLTVPGAAAHAQSSPSPYTTGTRYDAAGRVTGTIAPDPDGAGPLGFAAVRNTWDAAGRLTKVESGELSLWQSEAVAPASWTGFTVLRSVETAYDNMDRKVRETVKGSDGVPASLTQYSYDTLGRLQCTAVRMNPAVYGSLPTSACTLGTQGTWGPDRITNNVYDDAGQLLQVREGVGTSVEAAEAAEATYAYTPNGKKLYVIDGNGNRAQYTYDGLDRLARWYFPSTTRPTAWNDSTAMALRTAVSISSAD